MKTRSVIISTVFICLLPICSLMAECINKENQLEKEEIAAILKNYTLYATSKDESAGIYEICFDSAVTFGKFETTKKNIEITVPNNHKLKIVGLRFPDPTDPTPLDLTANDKMLILSGSNITLDNVMLMGAGSGTAIQIGDSNTMPPKIGANIKIQNSTLSNFGTGIDIANEATAQLLKNTYSKIGQKLFFNEPVPSAAKIKLVAKHLMEGNDKIVDYVIGKLEESACQNPVGSVEMYYNPWDIDKLAYHNTAKCSAPTIISEEIKMTTKDGLEEVLSKGSCSFKCDGFNEDINKLVSFAYTSASGKSEQFFPLAPTAFADFYGITITGTYTMPSTPSGGDTPIIVAGYQSPDSGSDAPGGILGDVPNTLGGPSTDPGTGQNTGDGDQKATTTPGDGGLVNQNAGSSSGGCGGASVMGEMGRASSATTACYSFLCSLLGLVPIAWRRYSKK